MRAGNTLPFNKELLEVVGKRNSKARAESRSDGNVGLTEKEANAFSFVRLMNAVSQPTGSFCTEGRGI